MDTGSVTAVGSRVEREVRARWFLAGRQARR